MTLDEIRGTKKEMLTPADVADVLGCDPYRINVQAKQDAKKLGFPVSMMGTRVRIPRLAFLHWMQYGCCPVIIKQEERAI